MSVTNEVSNKAIKWAESKLKRTLSADTIEQYKADYVRIVQSGIVPGEEDNPRTRYKHRAAYRYMAAVNIIAANNAGDSAKVDRIWKRLEVIKQIADNNQIKFASGGTFNDKSPRDSKKRSINKLPDDWRETIIKGQHKFRSHVAIMASTGCRPAEIAKGALVTRTADGYIYITIKGAKVTGEGSRTTGAKERMYCFKPNHPLASLVPDGMYQASRISVSKAVTREANKHWPQNDISGYSMRHQFSSDIKASGASRKEIAVALGHASTAAQCYYGNKVSGSAGYEPVSVSSTAAPRANDKVAYGATKKSSVAVNQAWLAKAKSTPAMKM